MSPVSAIAGLSLLALLGLTACGAKDGDSTAAIPGTPSTTGTDPLVSASLEPAPTAAPLTRVLVVETSRPTRVEATVTDGNESRTWRFAALDTSHRVPLIGFKPDRDWTVELTLVDESDQRFDADPLTTDRSLVPLHLPTWDVRTLEPDRVQPGFTLLNLRSRGNGQVSETWTMLDEALEPIWFQAQPSQAKMVTRLEDGTLIGLDGANGATGQWAVSRDLTGAILDEWHSDSTWGNAGHRLTGTWALHHDLIELPDGNLAALAKERDGHLLADYPGSYLDPFLRLTDERVNADRIVEFTRDGTVVRDIPLGPLMDPGRIGYDSLDNSFLDGRLDWIHANGLDYDPVGDRFIVSFRHQDAVVAVNAADGTVAWILGNPDNWAPEWAAKRLAPGDAATTWPYHQHSPDLSSDGRLVVFDNGNWRASPWTGEPTVDNPQDIRSRIVAYQLDLGAGTATQTWEFEPPGGHHSCPAVGGAKHLDNGNVLATFALVIAVDGVLNSEVGLGEEAVRIVELDPQTTGGPQIVADVFATVPASVEPVGWQAFFAERIPSPYGPDVLLP